jgi:hypothetical protein
MYDLIGDIHGCSATLMSLLEKLGYRSTDGVYRHPERQAVFLGDFIDRGPSQRAVLDIARPMVERGTALTVMGNHEFDAIAFATPARTGDGYLRRHSEKNLRQHGVFLDAYADDAEGYADTIAWFRTLPLWLDLGGIRVVHACWDRQWIDRIRNFQDGSPLLGDALLHASCSGSTWQHQAVKTLLKGKELRLAEGASYPDKEGRLRHIMRVRWWDRGARTYKDAFMGPESALTHIPDDEIEGDHLIEYSHEEPPVFLGHYWLEGKPAPLAANIACLDYSVGKPGGSLTAYRWDGEAALQSDRFVAVPRQEG